MPIKITCMSHTQPKQGATTMTTISDIQKRTTRQRAVALVAAEMVLRKGTRAQFSEIASAAGQMYPVVGQYWNWLTNEA